MDEPKNTEDIKINNYAADSSQPTPPPAPQVNPEASVPKEDIKGQTIGQIKMGTSSTPDMASQKPQCPQITPTVPKKNKIKMILMAVGLVMIIALGAAIFFLSQTTKDGNSIATMLGMDQVSFINKLTSLIHIIFMLIALVVFAFTMLGLFKMIKAKKEDKEAKRAGLKKSIISGAVLLIILIGWVFAYVYADSARTLIVSGIKPPIVTDPEQTLNLTAPIEVKFDASAAPIDKNKFQIISYDWDFGDETKGSSQIVTHTYEKIGRYDVLLSITKRNKSTGEETQDAYSVIVSVGTQALTAIISAEPQSGEAPLKVEFDASESINPQGTIDRYEWDFNNDGTFDDAEGIKVSHTFNKNGKYKISLRIVSKTGEYNVGEKEIVIQQKEGPEAVIEVVDEPTEYTIGVNYVFQADKSKSATGKIEKYEWNFGDGSKSAATKTISHVFENEGTYEVTLKVTDDKGEDGEVKKTIKVRTPQGRPKAVIQTQPPLGEDALDLMGKVPFEVTFDASGSTDNDNNIVDYKWDFESDGTYDEFGQTVSHSYTQEGTYKATLLILDADGNTNTAEIPIKVEAMGIHSVLKADKVEGTVPLIIEFDASGSTYDKGEITSYRWDFGDGSAQKLGSAKITHKYSAIGIYKTTVTVIGSDNSSSTAEVTITVREVPLTACFISTPEEGPAPLTAVFDPKCTTGTVTTYFWDFGDSGTATEIKPTHIFEKAGEYTVKLEITDVDNTVSRSELKITVK